jgi:prepilin-type N-terminal cleavage/methylation domain-containing protein
MMTPELPIAPINLLPRERSVRRCRRRGFTLLEGLTAAMILAILVLGVFGSLSAAYEQSASVRANATGILLARQLADEIISKPFNPTNSLGAGGLASRSLFTDVSNYNNYSDTSTSMPLLAGGTLNVTGSDAYNRSVSVAVGATPSIDAVSPTTDFAIVTVSVTCPNGQIVTIPELVANYSIQAN